MNKLGYLNSVKLYYLNTKLLYLFAEHPHIRVKGAIFQ